jgi:hypothetical protein
MWIPSYRAVAAFVAALSLAACAAPATEDEEASQEEALASEEESFSSYNASEAELASATPEDATVFDNELTLYAIPAPRLFGLKWNRPGGLARRVLLNEGLGFSRALGHAAVRVSCNGTTFLGSMVDTGSEFRDMVLKEKAGLGILFRSVPGAVEDPGSLQGTLDERYENGRISFIRFKIAPDTCQALLDYVQAYKAADVGDRYGFVRPLYREGSGCSAFSMAFLELANLDEGRFRDAWGFDVRVPMTLIGGPDNPGNKVSVLKLFTTFRPWAKESEPHQRLVGWDPTLMFTSIRKWARSGAEHVEKRGRAVGIVLDRSDVAPRAELANRTFWAGEPGAPRSYWGFGDP